MSVSATHLLLIPSYNSGDLVVRTVREARRFWSPVWVVVDGSLEYDSEQLAKMSCAFVYPDDPAFRSAAGPDGAEVVAMQFPRRALPH